MRPTATDAARSVVCVCLSVCWARDTRVCCTQTDEPIEMPFGGWGLWADSFGSRERCVWWGQDRTNPLAAEGWQVADAAFVKLLWLDCSLNVLFIVCVCVNRSTTRTSRLLRWDGSWTDDSAQPRRWLGWVRRNTRTHNVNSVSTHDTVFCRLLS